MNIKDFFDPANQEHLRAYRHLCRTGVWPPGFIPANCEMGYIWIHEINAMMTDAYLRIKCDDTTEPGQAAAHVEQEPEGHNTSCPHCGEGNCVRSVVYMNVESYGSNIFHLPCETCHKMIRVDADRHVVINSITASNRPKSESDF